MGSKSMHFRCHLVSPNLLAASAACASLAGQVQAGCKNGCLYFAVPKDSTDVCQGAEPCPAWPTAPAAVASCKQGTSYTMPVPRSTRPPEERKSLNARNAWALVLQARREGSAFEHSFLFAHLYCGLSESSFIISGSNT